MLPLYVVALPDRVQLTIGAHTFTLDPGDAETVAESLLMGSEISGLVKSPKVVELAQLCDSAAPASATDASSAAPPR